MESVAARQQIPFLPLNPFSLKEIKVKTKQEQNVINIKNSNSKSA